jgi:tetratricopeptide (TPR) repeat protein
MNPLSRFASAVLLMAFAAGTQNHMHMPEEIGHVNLPNSCSVAVGVSLNRGLSLYYSFSYEEARKNFTQAAGSDSRCAMAHWGEAISEYQPVEALPEGAQLRSGQEALARAKNADEQTPRERAYIDALAIVFDPATLPKAQSRAESYSAAMERVYVQYPSDLVAATLFALSLLSPELPDDPSLARKRKALEVLNQVLSKEPDNPGVTHFIIHASDNPEMASFGLEAAHRYAQIAPASAHALHMPSHIFARLGLWQDDIRSNLASEAAAASQGAMHMGAQHRLHAMEFLQYAYLQTGQDDKAREIAQQAATIKAGDLEPGFEGYYGWVEASFPIRLALETSDWSGALRVQLPKDAGPYVRRVESWSHAVAAGHVHDVRAADQAVLDYEATFTKPELIEEEGHSSAQLAETRAWALFAKGDTAGAVSLLRPVADHQDRVGKGEVELPAREMLADMLRLSNQPDAALTEYKISLHTDPGRFNALLHAGEVAQVLGRKQEAMGFYKLLLQNVSAADTSTKQTLAPARAFINGQHS